MEHSTSGFSQLCVKLYHSILPHTEARTAAAMAAEKVIFVDGALLVIVNGLQLSVEQQVIWSW